MNEGIIKAEKLYRSIKSIITFESKLDTIITVKLNGDYNGQGSYVDRNGDIQLWRYSNEEGGYWALLAHELVHAIAFDSSVKLGMLEWKSLWFYSEAWAEYIAQIIDKNKTGFPFYGFDEDIVVGYWLSSSNLSIASIRNNHNKYNLKCAYQSYTLRASWYRYIDETYGREKALKIMFGGKELTNKTVQEILGDSLSNIDKNWKTNVLKNFTTNPKAKTESIKYRNKINEYQQCY